MSLQNETRNIMRYLSPEIEVTAHPELCSVSAEWAAALGETTVNIETAVGALDTWAKAVGLDPSFTTDKLMDWPADPADRYASNTVYLGRAVSDSSWPEHIVAADEARSAMDEKAWEELLAGDETRQNGKTG